MFKSAFQEDYDDGAKAYFAKESSNPHADPARAADWQRGYDYAKAKDEADKAEWKAWETASGA